MALKIKYILSYGTRSLENLAVNMCHFIYLSVITRLVIQCLKLVGQHLIGNENGDFINGYITTMEVYWTFNILNIIFIGGRKFNLFRWQDVPPC
jgi:hypothetical protein